MSAVVLVAVLFGTASTMPPSVVVLDMPTMRTCESVGNTLATMNGKGITKWTCIENSK